MYCDFLYTERGRLCSRSPKLTLTRLWRSPPCKSWKHGYREAREQEAVMFKLKALPFAILLLQSWACAGSTIVGVDGDRLQTGTWGGRQAAVTVTSTGAHVEFPCASGDVSQ